MKFLSKITLLIVLLFTLNFTYAQAFRGEGDLKAQAGFVGWGYGSGITGSVDYGLTDLFSAGGGAEFYFGEGNNNFFLFGMGNLHLGSTLNLPKEMDLYPGIDLGLRGNGLGIGGHLGFRYYFNEKIGAYVEVGSRGSFGVSFNLN